LTGEELAVEAACEEERYLELNTDYMERVLYEGLWLFTKLII